VAPDFVPEFKSASYAEGYEIFLTKLLRECLYDAAWGLAQIPASVFATFHAALGVVPEKIGKMCLSRFLGL
jgi:hypothetical protein